MMWDLRLMIKQRARMGEVKFEGVWAKCLKSISKDYQNLRNGILTKRF